MTCVAFTANHPFYQQIKASYPTCFRLLTRDSVAGVPSGLFSARNFLSPTGETCLNVCGATITFTEKGATIVQYDGTLLLETEKWEEFEPHIRASEHVTYKI